MLSTAVTNALSIYCSVTNKNIKITAFKEELVRALFDRAPDNDIKQSHVLIKTEKSSRCKPCYKKKTDLLGRNAAQRNIKKIKTMCIGCNLHMCYDCFFSNHIIKPK